MGDVPSCFAEMKSERDLVSSYYAFHDTAACHHGDQAKLHEGGMLEVNACLGAFFCLPCYITVLCMLSHVFLVPYLALRYDYLSALVDVF